MKLTETLFPASEMFNFRKKSKDSKSSSGGGHEDPDEKERRKREKKERKELKRRLEAAGGAAGAAGAIGPPQQLSGEELRRLEEVRRSLKMSSNPSAAKKLPSGITADYRVDGFDATNLVRKD